MKAGVRVALQRLMQHTSGPGLLLLPALAAGLLLAGVPPMLVRLHCALLGQYAACSSGCMLACVHHQSS